MFIRLFNSPKVLTKKGYYHVNAIEESENIVSFNVKNNDINFFDDTLQAGMLLGNKESKKYIDYHPIFLITFSNGKNFMFSDENQRVSFLEMCDDGIIRRTMFNELTTDSSIIIYNKCGGNDFAIVDIDEMYVFALNDKQLISTFPDNIQKIISETDFNINNIYYKERHSGIIIEDIMII